MFPKKAGNACLSVWYIEVPIRLENREQWHKIGNVGRGQGQDLAVTPKKYKVYANKGQLPVPSLIKVTRLVSNEPRRTKPTHVSFLFSPHHKFHIFVFVFNEAWTFVKLFEYEKLWMYATVFNICTKPVVPIGLLLH